MDSIDPRSPSLEIIARAALIIARGGVVVFPTTGLYGLGADAANSQAVDNLFQVKQRPETKPVLVLVNTVKEVTPLVRDISPDAHQIMDALWPGGITLVFHASDMWPRNLCADTGKIGIRMAAHPVARALVEKLGHPITGTSANISGQPGVNDCAHLSPLVKSQVGMVLDAGPLAGGPGSTILDVTQSPPRILRQGAVSQSSIEKIVTTN